MSYFDRCPDRWEAEREGRDDASRQYSGYYRSPDSDHFECEDAQRAYEDAYRSEMRHQEERREEEEARERYERHCREERETEAAAEEEAYYRAMEEARAQDEYDRAMQAEYGAAMSECPPPGPDVPA